MPRIRAFRWTAWAEWTISRLMDDEPTLIAVDTETSGVGFNDEPFAATLTWRSPDGSLVSGYIDLEAPEGLEHRKYLLRTALAETPTWVFHNAKFDLQKLMLVDIINEVTLARVELHDTQTIYHLLDENGRKGLKHLAATVLKVDHTIPVEIKSGPNKGTFKRVPKEEHRLAEVRRKLGLKKEDGYHLLPREVLIPYALKDTEFTLRLYETLMPRLEAKDEDLQRLYRDSMRVKLALLRMESNGIALDLPYLERTTSEYGEKVMRGWQRVVDLTGKPELNLNSPAQLKEAFAERGVFLDSTAVGELTKVEDELAQAILDYRTDQKVHKTYLTALLREQRDGIVHPNFRDDGARTGRMSSGGASNNT